ncbi:MAG TPA: tetratricopeptide repeat protein [Bacteroidia bacterium]|nr:tetratricopeptide repeat protein [Bacteroidia bacterium]
MKQTNLFIFGLATLGAMSLASCSGLGKMSKKEATVEYTVTPNPLEEHNDSVNVTVTVKYPAKYFGKKVALTITPQCGNHKFKSVTLLGEKAEGTGTKIAYKTGGSYTYTDHVAYTSDMLDADLMLNATGAVKKKTKDMPARKIGHGTIITPYLLKNDDKPIIGKDKFVKTVPNPVDGSTHFVISSTTYTPKNDIKGDGMKPVNDFLKAHRTDPNMEITNISISSYASPDGETDMNQHLAEDRYTKTMKDMMAMQKDKKNGYDPATKDAFYVKAVTAEDWNGFQQLVSASSIKDKDLILRVLSSYPDGDKREAEIKNMSATYVELAKDILPQLRRSQVTVNAIKHNRSDERILQLAKSTPDSLSVEEILYAATLTTDMNEKLNFYKAAERMYGTDWRTSNNVGCVLLMQNKLADAKAEFNKADKLSPNNPIIMNNMAICTRWEGNRKDAKAMLDKAKSAGPEVSYNLGIIAIQDGMYTDAVTDFGTNQTFNAALAKVLSGDLDGAMTTLDKSSEKEDALSYYLRAVIGARKGNKDMMLSNLKTAISKDPSYKDHAKSDVEFLKYRDDADFKAAIS